MDKKVTGIVAYITWIGLLVAYFAGDKEGAKFHINQSLVIWLGYLGTIIINAVLGGIPVIGFIIGIVLWIVNIILLIGWIIGFVAACKGEEKEIPFLGTIKILK